MHFDLKDSEVTRDSLFRTFRKSLRVFVGETSERLSAKRLFLRRIVSRQNVCTPLWQYHRNQKTVLDW